MSRLNKLISCLVLAALLLPCLTAFAAEKTVYVKDVSVTVYATNSTSGKVLGKLYLGQSAVMTAAKGDWVQLKEGGKTGYCLSSGLSKSDVNKYDKTLYANGSAVRVYDIPSESGSVIALLAQNDTVKGVAISSDKTWCRVKTGSRYGYMRVADISTSRNGDEIPEGADVMYAAKTIVYVYENPSLIANTLEIVSYGEKVAAGASANGYTKVKTAKGTVGYCESEDLTDIDPNRYSKVVYAQKDTVKVYAIADTTGTVLRTVRYGTAMTAVAVTGDKAWYRVEVDNAAGYVPAEDVGEKQPSGSVTGYVKTASANVYSAKSEDSQVIETVSVGMYASVYSYDKTWAYVVTQSGAKGYMLVKALSKTDVNRSNTTMYAVKKDAPVYEGAYESSRQLKLLAAAAKVTVIAVSSDKKWCRVTASGTAGYMKMSDLTEKNISKGKTVYATGKNAALYSKRSTASSAKLGTLYFGESATMVGTSGNWAMLVLGDGTVAYANKKQLSTANPNNQSKKLYVSAAAASLYKGANAKSQEIAVLNVNDQVTVTAYSSDKTWCRVKFGTSVGYMKASALSAKKATATTAVYASASGARIYRSNSTSSAVLDTMYFGESAMMYSYKGGWAMVSFGGLTGYARTKDLAKTDPNKLSVTCYAQESSVFVYDTPAKGTAIVYTLSLNESCVCVMRSSDGKWLRVKAGKVYGYVPSSSVDDEKATAVTVFAVDDIVTVYAKEDEDSSEVAEVSYGESLKRLSQSGSWAYVQTTSGKKGYCFTSSVSTSDPNTLNKKAYSKADNTKVYAQPSTSADVIATMKKNYTFTVKAQTSGGDWCRILNSNGSWGYVQTDRISPSEESGGGSGGGESDDTYGKTMASLISLALSKQGCKYVYATQGPNTFDCSGFTNYLYRTIYGITLSRSAYGQGYQTKYPIIEKLTDLKPGDVVCFNTNSDDDDMSDHVGLYLGNGQFIHASYSAGKVIISNFTNYYKSVFFHAFRPVSG